jgi:uncharacterized damage-inducible protein DinB
VPDQKPPRLEGDERQTLHTLLQYQRESMVTKLAGVDDEAARRVLVASGTTLLWLITHMAKAEVSWVVRRFAGEDDSADDAISEADDATVADAIAAYRNAWARVDAIVAAAPSLDEPCRNLGDDPPVNLRWVVTHLLEETARHAGHADILRELIDGSTGR